MKFDVIIGNPPYQISDGDGGNGSSSTPLYDKFIIKAKELNPRYLSMIVPARWYSGGKGLDDFRDSMLNDTRIKELHDYSNAGDCFKNVEIKGGVCYFLWDRDYIGKCSIVNYNSAVSSMPLIRPLKEVGMDTLIRYNDAVSIYHKVKDFKEATFNNIVSSSKPFGFRSNFNGLANKTETTVLLYRNGGTSYVENKEIKVNRNLISKYKVLISKAYGAGETIPHQILGKPIVAEDNSCCTETYLVVGPFETKDEADNCASYMKTKFFRFMVSLVKNTQNTCKSTYVSAPIQDFTKSWTDTELYNKYNLDENEIAFIESMTKEI